MKSLIEKAYDPSNFREKAHRLVDQLADYLEETTEGKSGPVFSSFDPDLLYEEWGRDLNNLSKTDFNDWCEKLLTDSIHIHDPGYMGHQVSPVLPEAALGDLLGSVLNNGMGVYEMGSPSVAIEHVVIKYLASKLGFDDTADGILTSGGTLGNLTALLAARQIMAEHDIWNDGNVGMKAGIMVSEEAHYSISRAVKIMGWGEQGLIKVPVDEKFQLDPNQLEKCLTYAQKEDIKVIGVVGNACSTGTGSFDPLNEIADFCQDHNLWFHVDAAHGGGAVYSQKYKNLLDGVQRADSVIVDYHKMLMCPALVTGVVFRDGLDSYQTFAQKAAYLWKNDEKEWYNLGKRTFECTKDMMTLKVYTVMREYGPELFQKIIDRQFDLAKTFAGMVKERRLFDLLIPPESNIVCFRYLPENRDRNNDLNQQIRNRLLENGKKYIVQTTINDKLYLRTTLMNVFTTSTHLRELLDEIEEIADEIGG